MAAACCSRLRSHHHHHHHQHCDMRVICCILTFMQTQFNLADEEKKKNRKNAMKEKRFVFTVHKPQTTYKTRHFCISVKELFEKLFADNVTRPRDQCVCRERFLLLLLLLKNVYFLFLFVFSSFGIPQ